MVMVDDAAMPAGEPGVPTRLGYALVAGLSSMNGEFDSFAANMSEEDLVGFLDANAKRVAEFQDILADPDPSDQDVMFLIADIGGLMVPTVGMTRVLSSQGRLLKPLAATVMGTNLAAKGLSPEDRQLFQRVADPQVAQTVVEALQGDSEGAVEAIKALGVDATPEMVSKLQSVVEEGTQQFARLAKMLASLPDSPTKQAVITLIDPEGKPFAEQENVEDLFVADMSGPKNKDVAQAQADFTVPFSAVDAMAVATTDEDLVRSVTQVPNVLTPEGMVEGPELPEQPAEEGMDKQMAGAMEGPAPQYSVDEMPSEEEQMAMLMRSQSQ